MVMRMWSDFPESTSKSREERREYIKDAVGKCDEKNPKTQMLFMLIIQDLYENRVLTVKEADKQRLTHVVGSMVLQLQVSQLEEENG